MSEQLVSSRVMGPNRVATEWAEGTSDEPGAA